jgi:hypothetical protein
MQISCDDSKLNSVVQYRVPLVATVAQEARAGAVSPFEVPLIYLRQPAWAAEVGGYERPVRAMDKSSERAM